MVQPSTDRPICEVCGIKPVDKGPKIKGKQYWARSCWRCPSPPRRTALERFNRQYRKEESGCWEWTGSKDVNGYGRIGVGTSNSTPAHRWSYEHFVGKIPDGFHICHKCDNPGCVNPEHLFAGTHQDNMRDMFSKMRHQHGERHSKAKLTGNDVLAIRQLFEQGETKKGLARRYGVSSFNIRAIINRKTWVHI